MTGKRGNLTGKRGNKKRGTKASARRRAGEKASGKKHSGKKASAKKGSATKRRPKMGERSLAATMVYRARCQNGDFEGSPRNTRSAATKDALLHQQNHPGHIVDVLVDQS
jgi:hypothetical protein